MMKISLSPGSLVSSCYLTFRYFSFRGLLGLPLRTILLSLSLILFQSSLSAKVDYISIGTGGISGIYYPTGGAICYLVNKLNSEDRIHCEIKSTLGSRYNLNALKKYKIDVAVVQSDWQHHAYNGTSWYQDKGKFTNLRSLFSVHLEPFTVLVRKDENVQTFEDIKGKRINIGSPNSGQRGTMDMLLELYGWHNTDFAEVTSLTLSQQAQALCNKKIDVIIYVVGHPNGSIEEASSACQTKLVNVTGDNVSKLTSSYGYYDTAIIPGGLYRGSPDKVDTFGVAATVVTTAELADKVAYEMVKELFENHANFVQLHPSFKNLTKHAMATQYLTAPLHPGALRYYKEVGLIK